jgi:DNA-directed RNA polymerase subunit K/omega
MKSTEYKKLKLEPNAITRNPSDFDKDTENIYEAVAILSKRANQIAMELKDEFIDKVHEYRTGTENNDEINENREQIDLAKYFEQLPKPSILAIHEFENGQIYYNEPADLKARHHVHKE